MIYQKCLFYGSLRNEGYNCVRIRQNFGKESCKFIKEINVKGYNLFDTGYGYPAVVAGDKSSNVVMEVFDVSNEAFKSIDRMELGAGYHREEIEVEGETYFLYVYPEASKGFKLVEDGDWIKYQLVNN